MAIAKALTIAALLAWSAGAATSVPALAAGGNVTRVSTVTTPIALTGSTSTCSSACSYAWSQIAGPSVLVWSSRTVAAPTVSGAINGEYRVRLKVTGGDTATADLVFGAVATDSANVTIPGVGPATAHLLGSSLIYGLSPWPELDTRQRELADLFGGLQGGNWGDYWDTHTPAAGTVTFDNAKDKAILGTGTSFTTTFACGPSDGAPDSILVRYTSGGVTKYWTKRVLLCADNTHLTIPYGEDAPTGTWQFMKVGDWGAFWETDPAYEGTITIDSTTDTNIVGAGTHFLTQFACDGSDYIIVRYQEGGQTLYHAKAVTSCSDDTHLVWGYTENMPVGSGLQFTSATAQDAFFWTNPKTNINYYDNVLAFYGLYRRTRQEKYRTYARWLAERWMRQPWYVLGKQDGDGMNAAGRMHQLLGLMVYAEDGHPEVWGKLDLLLDRFDGYLNSTSNLPIKDPREEAFFLRYVAVASFAHPVEAKRDAHRAAVQNALNNRWAASRESGGYWRSWNTMDEDTYGPVTITAPRAVTSATPKFSSDDCGAGKKIWFTAGGADITGDAVTYGCTFNSSTSLTLTSDYAGTPGTKRFNTTKQSASGGAGLLGPGVSTFFQGVVLTALYDAYVATGDSRIPTWMSSLSQWLQTVGYQAGIKGWWYSLLNPGCEDPAAYAPCNMGADSDYSRRGLWGEIYWGMALARRQNPATTSATWPDIGIGVNFGGAGGPQTSDGWSSTDIAPGWIQSVRWAKVWGFYCGAGACDQIMAERLGGPAAQSLSNRTIAFVRPANATSTTARVTDPSGHVRDVTCASSPCTVQVDTRQGGEAQLRLIHTNGGTTIASASIGLLR